MDLKGYFKAKKHSGFVTMILRGFALYYLLLLSMTFAGVYLSGGKFIVAMDHLFFLVFSLVVIFQRGGEFLLSLSKYFILFLSFAGMRGFADNVNPYVNYDMPIAFDTLMGGGQTVTEVLQQGLMLVAPSVDRLAIFMYATHFFVPFLFGMLLWFVHRKNYEPYFLALVLTTYLGLGTFLLMPVAPPWLAAQQGLIGIEHITMAASAKYGFTMLPSLYMFFNANPVAAFPSLHFAFPLLVSYFVIRSFGWRCLPILLYPALMGFSLVYLGEHYVFDLLGGFLYAAMGIILSAKMAEAYHAGSLHSIYRNL